MVVMSPRFTFMPGVSQTQAPVGIESCCPNPAIERYCDRIVGRFSRLAEVQHDIMLVRPQVEVFRLEPAPWSALTRFGRPYWAAMRSSTCFNLNTIFCTLNLGFSMHQYGEPDDLQR